MTILISFVFFFVFFNFSKKKIGFYKLLFCSFYFNSIPRILNLIHQIPTPIPHILTMIHRIPTPIPRIPTPHSPHSHPDSSHSHPYSLHFHSSPRHSSHPPHSVPRFHIPAFKDRPLDNDISHIHQRAPLSAAPCSLSRFNSFTIYLSGESIQVKMSIFSVIMNNNFDFSVNMSLD